MKLIIDELEAELDDIKSGNKNINITNKNNLEINTNNGTNTNRLKQLSVSLNNTSLINHLKKENERLRKLVVANEFKNKRFFEESQKTNKIKKNMININNHFYFSIINPSTNLNTNANTNSNSIILDKANNEIFSNNSNKKIKTSNNIINNKNVSSKKNIKENKDKTFKKEKKMNKIIKDIKNHNLLNSNRSINNNINEHHKNNMSTNNYNKITHNNKNKKSNLISLYNERTNALIEKQNNSLINNVNTNFNNYNNLINNKVISKNALSSNKRNKSILEHKNKKNKKSCSSVSRNYSRGLNKHFNNSFNESFIDKKYLRTMINIEKTVPKNNDEHNQTMILRSIGKEKAKRRLQEYQLDSSNDYLSRTKNSVKKIKKIKKVSSNEYDGGLSEQKLSSSKNYYNTVGNDFSNYKSKIKNLNGNVIKKKTSGRGNNRKNKSINKHEKDFNSLNFMA